MTLPRRLSPARRRAAQPRAVVAVLLLSVASTACAARGTGTGDAAASDDGGLRTARLIARTNPPVGGTATLSPASGGGLYAQIKVQGSPARSNAYPWRVFAGACGIRGGSILGSGVDYPIIQMQANGTGESEAFLSGERPEGSAHVRVYASTTSNTVIACGDFRR